MAARRRRPELELASKICWILTSPASTARRSLSQAVDIPMVSAQSSRFNHFRLGQFQSSKPVEEKSCQVLNLWFHVSPCFTLFHRTFFPVDECWQSHLPRCGLGPEAVLERLKVALSEMPKQGWQIWYMVFCWRRLWAKCCGDRWPDCTNLCCWRTQHWHNGTSSGCYHHSLGVS